MKHESCSGSLDLAQDDIPGLRCLGLHQFVCLRHSSSCPTSCFSSPRVHHIYVNPGLGVHTCTLLSSPKHTRNKESGLQDRAPEVETQGSDTGQGPVALPTCLGFFVSCNCSLNTACGHLQEDFSWGTVSMRLACGHVRAGLS